MDLIIRNGTLVDYTGTYQANIAVKDGKIHAIFQGNKLKNADNTIDAQGMLVFPGIIDTHTHFQLQDKGKIISSDTFNSGSKAAALGGVTTFIDFSDQIRGKSPLKGFYERKRIADSQVVIDYGLHVSKTDVDYLDEIPTLIKEGVPSFKFFTTYSWRDLNLNDVEILQLFKAINKCRGMVIGHCENDSMILHYQKKLIEEKNIDPIYHAKSRPHIAEEEAIQRVILFAKRTNVDLHIAHITTKEGSDLLYHAKQQKIKVTGETCPHYLLLNESAYEGSEGYLNVMSPPLRYTKDQQGLINRILDETITQLVTDHCEFTREDKGNGKLPFYKIANGIPNIETFLPLMFDLLVYKQKMPINLLVKLMSTNPAINFGLYPNKGSLMIGTDADLVIFDPNLKKTIITENLHYNIDWNPYSGMEIKGWPLNTILRGKILCDNGNYIGHENEGRFLKRRIRKKYHQK